MFELLLSYWADVGLQECQGNRPLLALAKAGLTTELMHALGDHPAICRIVDATDRDGYTLLLLATPCNKSCLMQCLIEKGADVNFTTLWEV